MEELAAMESFPPSELSFLGTSGIVLNNDASTLNPNITLNLHKGGSAADLELTGSFDASRSDSTSHASSDSKKGNVYSLNVHILHLAEWIFIFIKHLFSHF